MHAHLFVEPNRYMCNDIPPYHITSYHIVLYRSSSSLFYTYYLIVSFQLAKIFCRPPPTNENEWNVAQRFPLASTQIHKLLSTRSLQLSLYRPQPETRPVKTRQSVCTLQSSIYHHRIIALRCCHTSSYAIIHSKKSSLSITQSFPIKTHKHAYPHSSIHSLHCFSLHSSSSFAALHWKPNIDNQHHHDLHSVESGMCVCVCPVPLVSPCPFPPGCSIFSGSHAQIFFSN